MQELLEHDEVGRVRTEMRRLRQRESSATASQAGVEVPENSAQTEGRARNRLRWAAAGGSSPPTKVRSEFMQIEVESRKNCERQTQPSGILIHEQKELPMTIS